MIYMKCQKAKSLIKKLIKNIILFPETFLIIVYLLITIVIIIEFHIPDGLKYIEPVYTKWQSFPL